MCEAGRAGHGKRIRLVGVEMDLAVVVVGATNGFLIDCSGAGMARHDLLLLETLNPGAEPPGSRPAAVAPSTSRTMMMRRLPGSHEWLSLPRQVEESIGAGLCEHPGIPEGHRSATSRLPEWGFAAPGNIRHGCPHTPSGVFDPNTQTRPSQGLVTAVPWSNPPPYFSKLTIRSESRIQSRGAGRFLDSRPIPDDRSPSGRQPDRLAPDRTGPVGEPLDNSTTGTTQGSLRWSPGSASDSSPSSSRQVRVGPTSSMA